MSGKPALDKYLNMDGQSDIADEDAVLVRRAQNGDMNAFEELVGKYEARVFSIASHMLAFNEDAKDAAQEAFLKAYRSLKGFRGDSKFSTWLYRIINNVCIDFLRRRERRDLPLEFTSEDGEGEPFTLEIPADIDIEAAVEDKEFRFFVQKAINSLPEQHRVMIVMRDIQDLSYMEISDLLGLPEGTVKSRINRARGYLRTAFLNLKELKEYIHVK